MFVSLFALFLALPGPGESLHLQTLHCPHQRGQRNLDKVWCKQTSVPCCSGFAFPEGMRTLANGNLQVQQDPESFTITIRELAQGDGTYWCGLLQSNNTIIRLNEKYFSRDPPLHSWNIVRWALMPVLPLAVIITHICANRKARKQEEGQYDDVSTAVSQGHRKREDHETGGL